MSSDSTVTLKQDDKTVVDVARELSRYSLDAFEFLHEALDFTVQQKHGPDVEGLRRILEWLDEKKLSSADLPKSFSGGKLPPTLKKLVKKHGGPIAVQNRLNLHVGGQDLCRGLRDLALERWGLMAPAVLNGWGIRSTSDFGQMVFALVDSGMLHVQPDDQLSDFDDVFDFAHAFDRSFRIDLAANARKIDRSE